ncbi:unnamed protein product [Mytilus coruscus]|uniref:RNA-directed DNA polymerase n=1 Tax=Mytilus coruscus TaxID=42192 RepID=A0A6J8DA96_MYTCO|nr:unnamed protein product [Mytilus coruscus]
MPTYGRIEEFKFENNFEEYTERLEEYFLANEIDDDKEERNRRKFTRLRKIESEPEENSDGEVFTVKTCRTSDNKELKLDVKIEDVDYVMELDTGAAVSIIGEENYKRLYRYTRLPFGAASSPAIFQEFMDKVLEGLDGVGCILDDLIITGKYLYGRKFTLITDNKPLSLLLGPKTGIPMLAASRIQRWAIQLSGYQYDVKCKSSSENANADGLSRLPLKETLCESPFNIFWEEVEIRNVLALNNYGQCK